VRNYRAFLREDNHMSAKGSPVRVMHIVTRMNTGGVAVLLANLIRNFDPKEIDARLVVGRCDSSEEDYLENVATDIKSVKVPSLQRAISPNKDFSALIELVKQIREFKPDVVHTHTSKAGLLGRLAAMLAAPKAKRIHTFHGHLLEGYFSEFKTNLLVKSELILANRTHRLIAMGNQVKSDLLSVGVGKDRQYSVFFPGLKPAKTIAKAQAREELNLDLDSIYCLFVGRLTQIKRPDRLLDAVSELKDRNISVKFIVAGDGELKDSVLARITGENLPVTMLGWQKDTSSAFSAADIMVLCSDNEAVSLVLIEGSQHSLPLVSTDVGSVGDVVIDHSTGYLTESNASSLADAIEKLVRDAQLRKLMGEAGKARADQYFSLERMLKDHTDLYRSL
jgi:glycosyltransferase involved in cell wall biosynthesis